MPLIIPANSITGGYVVDNSLRFNDDSSDYVYVEGIYLTKEVMDIYEMGIFDKNDNILFYSYFDQIYKPENVDFKVKFKIEKIYN